MTWIYSWLDLWDALLLERKQEIIKETRKDEIRKQHEPDSNSCCSTEHHSTSYMYVCILCKLLSPSFVLFFNKKCKSFTWSTPVAVKFCRKHLLENHWDPLFLSLQTYRIHHFIYSIFFQTDPRVKCQMGQFPLGCQFYTFKVHQEHIRVSGWDSEGLRNHSVSELPWPVPVVNIPLNSCLLALKPEKEWNPRSSPSSCLNL